MAAEPTDPGSDELVNVIVTFKATPGKAARDAVQDAGAKIRREFKIINAISVELPANQVENLKKHPLVTAVEPDGEIVALERDGSANAELANAWGVEYRAVHDAGIQGQAIKVALIDTGIDYVLDDPDNVDTEFLGNYRGGYDFVNDDADPMDDNGHGTQIARTLAARRTDYAVVGVAPGVELYGLKVLGANGSGDYSGLIAALEWAVANNIDVVNMSLGGYEASAALQSAVEAAYRAGIVLVAAAGNATTLQDLRSRCAVPYPAAYGEVIAVASTDVGDDATGFSCTGPQVDLAAPGTLIYSFVPFESCPWCAPYVDAPESRSSIASPHVAGVAALVLSHGIANAGDPRTLADDVKAHLCATASLASIAPSDPRNPAWYGCGVVNALQALIVAPPPPPADGNPLPAAAAGPIAVDDFVLTTRDTPVYVSVMANDVDPDDDPLIVAAVTDPPNGSATVEFDGSITYFPDPGYEGSDAFYYRISDGAGGADTGRVTVKVVQDPGEVVDGSTVPFVGP
jgi:subtilisin